MNGLDLTKQIMATCPKPILVISVAVRPEDSHNTQSLLKAGAVDMWPKPSSGLQSDYEKAKLSLITKIKVLAGVKVFRRPLQTTTAHKQSAVATLADNRTHRNLAASATVPSRSPVPASAEYQSVGHQTAVERLSANLARKAENAKQKAGDIKIVAIGASTGGPQAVSAVLANFDKNFPVPILCTQHISTGFLQGLVDCMQADWKLRVKIAERGEFPQPGVVYYAPEQHHLSIDLDGRFVYGQPSPSDLHCPSVNMMFESVARYYGKSALGILLTGMGRDGARGLKTLRDAGSQTIAQDEATSIVFGMPREAIKMGAAQTILPLPDIAHYVLTQL